MVLPCFTNMVLGLINSLLLQLDVLHFNTIHLTCVVLTYNLKFTAQPTMVVKSIRLLALRNAVHEALKWRIKRLLNIF